MYKLAQPALPVAVDSAVVCSTLNHPKNRVILSEVTRALCELLRSKDLRLLLPLPLSLLLLLSLPLWLSSRRDLLLLLPLPVLFFPQKNRHFDRNSSQPIVNCTAEKPTLYPAM